MKVIHELLEYKNINIVQDTQMFNFSLDSVLLPNFVEIKKNTRKILDIGCGNAVIPLILSTRCNSKIIGVEIQKEVYDLALESVKINNLENQIEIINADINEFYKNQESDSFDLITCNPPFFKVFPNSNYNDLEYKTIARHEVKLNLDDLFKISKKLLKNNGVVAIVHRSERLVDIIESMRKNNIEPKRIQFVYPFAGSESNIILIEGTKNGKPGIKILDSIYAHNSDGSYSDKVKEFFGK